MKIMMVKCDNPGCRNTEHPESESKPYVPPYGWLRLKGDFVGTGPAINVEVCSTACLEAAVDNAVAESEERHGR